jgi:superfamily II DNA or RNA helicase
MATTGHNNISQTIQRKYLPYVDDMDDLMYTNPNFKFYVGFDNQQMMFRMYVRNAIHLDKIVRHFREIDQSSFFTGRREPLYLYAVSPFGYFPTGLLFEVLNFIVNDFELNPMKMASSQMVLIGPRAKSYIYEYLVPLAKKMTELNIDKDNFEVDNISLDRAEDPEDPNVRVMRPYQEDAIRAIILKGNGRCLIQSPTGSGKSFIIANLIYTLQQQFFKGETFRTLIYVPNIQLVEQFYKDLLEYGFKDSEVCRFSGATKKKDKANLLTANIVIANSTYCLQHIAEIGKIDMVIGDEAHKTFNHGTAGFSVLENFLIETKLRVGLSGTLPKGFKFYQMVGLTGPKVFDTSVTELQDQGFISHCDITRLNIEVKDVMSNRELLFHPNSIYKVNSVDETGMSLVGSGDPFRAEQKYMVDNCEKLFQPVLNYIINETTPEDNAIILFDRTEMGERLFNYLDLLKERKLIDRTPLFIDGSIPVAERERVRKYVEDNSGCLLVGQSAILSTGINIKSLSKLVLFVGGKSMARTIQSIGRILRLKEGKQCEVIDSVYSMKYSKRHGTERKRLYKEFYDKGKFDKIVDIEI